MADACGIIVGPPFETRSICLLDLQDLAALAQASPAHHRLAGLFAVQHCVWHRDGRTKTELYSVEPREFYIDILKRPPS